MRKRHIVIRDLSRSTIFFPNYLINGKIFGGKKMLLNTKCVVRFSLQRLSETFLTLRRNVRDMIKNVNWYSCKVPVIPARFSWNFKFLDRFSKNTRISNFMKFRSVGADMFHADGQTKGRTDRHNEGNSHFSQFLRTLLQTSQLMLYREIIAVCSITSIQNAWKHCVGRT
jgi:hypothetical protein